MKLITKKQREKMLANGRLTVSAEEKAVGNTMSKKDKPLVEVHRRGELVSDDGYVGSLEGVRRGKISSWLRRRAAEADTEFTEAMSDNVSAKIDFMRVAERAKDLDDILAADRAERQADLVEKTHRRDTQVRLMQHAEELDNLAYKKQKLIETQEIERLEREAELRNLSQEERIKRKAQERLEQVKAEKMALIEEQKLRREMIAMIEAEKQGEVDQYVKKVQKEESREIDPYDESTWDEVDRIALERIDNEYTLLINEM